MAYQRRAASLIFVLCGWSRPSRSRSLAAVGSHTDMCYRAYGSGRIGAVLEKHCRMGGGWVHAACQVGDPVSDKPGCCCLVEQGSIR